MRRLAADDRAERDDAGVAARLRERHRGQGQLESTRHGQHRDPLVRDAGGLERLQRTPQEQVRDAAVEPGDDDADRAPLAERRAFEHRVAVGDVDLAPDVLDADVGRNVLDHRRRVGGRPTLERVAVLGGLGLRLGLGRCLHLRLRRWAGLAVFDVGHSFSGS